MRAIFVLFDTLNRRFLPPYGAKDVVAPHFADLAERSVTFDNAYGGSMPCMPARRELHTGRHNFLHRGWGPLEPFDDSMPELLTRAGVYTHLVTDHQHYWADGGATYHPRFRTFEFFRGQEGDEWKGHVADPPVPDNQAPTVTNGELRRQDRVNRLYMASEAEHPQTRTFDAGLHFIRTNAGEDDWFLQIETFDPHEPFFTYDDYRKLYDTAYDGPELDWPDYVRVSEPQETVDHTRSLYSALLTMCDHSLGRVLAAMDEHDMWDDTMLIVGTDHGFLLGEHDWWGKNTPPYFQETIHLPLFVWDPRSRRRGERRTSLVQTIDLAPTLLDFFGQPATPDTQGVPLAHTVACDEPVREAGLFGIFGGHVNVTDGRWVYLRAPARPGNQPLAEYTLMPALMRGRMPVEVLREATLAAPFGFTKGVSPLRVPGAAYTDPYTFGSMLFDLDDDPGQHHPVVDDEQELRMATLMRDLMVAGEAPAEQFARMGLPATGPLTSGHLLCREQAAQVETSRRRPLRAADFPGSRIGVTTPIATLLADPAAVSVLRTHLGDLVDGPLPDEVLELGLLDVAGVAVGLIPTATLHRIADELAEL
ncbi:sulfatase-like hydrolase/transferase [Streptomyces sp. OM5714]|uniref:sulfatase-like hydrolase/transferase n=1 Tax=Streptomyces sp. OM5714 TaxID=2602736 RepID=UPI0013DB363F|nr:sulfatase-like hydrolase/transferase [Streptomyces sp. OM5714]KAF2776966.1 Choline-sulfatase [Streptomyces sp. OM5714]